MPQRYLPATKSFPAIEMTNSSLSLMDDFGDNPGLIIPKLTPMKEMAASLDRDYDVTHPEALVVNAKKTGQCPVDFEGVANLVMQNFGRKVVVGTSISWSLLARQLTGSNLAISVAKSPRFDYAYAFHGGPRRAGNSIACSRIRWRRWRPNTSRVTQPVRLTPKRISEKLLN